MYNKILYLQMYSKKRRYKIMCKILKDIQGKTASEILEIYGKPNQLPVDILSLVSNMGISIVPMDFSIIERDSGIKIGSILGATISKDEDLNIFYRQNNTENRKRFTIAHEIAHCCLHTDNLIDHHIEFRDSYNMNTQKEYEANIFAGELLIPETAIHKVYHKLIVPSLDALTQIFKVSSTVMAARLDYLKMPYLKDIEIDEV